MPEIRYTLLADGPSDRALMPHLTWLLQQRLPNYAVQPEMADLRRLPPSKQPKGLAERIKTALYLYQCDLLFIHRDAEREPRDVRVAEIQQCLLEVGEINVPPVVCVVPVRMQEAWLLFDEAAIREAAGNSKSRTPLDLPSPATLENRPDPKQDLYELLKGVKGWGSHRMHHFSVSKAAQRVSECVEDFSPLLQLPAFRALEADINQVVQDQNW